MKISEIVKKGELPYRHYYNHTMVGVEVAHHRLQPPNELVTIASNHADAECVIYGDDSLGIEIGGRLWACELPDPELRDGKRLPKEVWQYCNLALGRNGDTRSMSR